MRFGLWNRRNPAGLITNLLVATVIVGSVNWLVFRYGAPDSLPPSHFDIPGWVIGVVWTVLFAGLAVARWLVLPDPARREIFWLLVFCALYPLYTFGLRSISIGLIGDAVSFLAAIFVARRAGAVSRVAGWLVLAVAAWCGFATVLTVLQVASS